MKMLVLMLVAVANLALADQWQPAQPFEKVFFGGRLRASIKLPAAVGKHSTVEVTERGKKGSQVLCAGDLVNELRPVDLLISKDGKSFVTFDEWGAAGRDHTIVIYRCIGHVARLQELLLEDFLTLREVLDIALPTVSSREWRSRSTQKIEIDELLIFFKKGPKIYISLTTGAFYRGGMRRPSQGKR